MSVIIRDKNPNPVLLSIANSFQQYADNHPLARIDLYRQNEASVRVRIIDPEFASLSRPERHDAVWRDVPNLSNEELDEINMLVTLAPEEEKESFSNLEFENPLPSRL